MVSRSEKKYDKRPWGEYRVLWREPGMWVKRIEVKPGQRLSLQKHSFRDERWVIVEGKGFVTRNKEKIRVKQGTCVSIGLGDLHRVTNTGKTPLVFVEVALGKKLSESDIVRIEDDYGRA